MTGAETIGALIVRRRKALNLRQEELADLLSEAGEGITVSQSQVSKLENTHGPDVALSPALVRALGRVLGAPEEFMAAAGYPVDVAPGWTDDDLVTLRQIVMTIDAMEGIREPVKQLLKSDLMLAMQQLPRREEAGTY
jgi:transcriptional regulator with XRE-family HTH domain